MSGSGISWAICKSAPRSRQITTPVPRHSVFYRPDALPAAQPTASKHRRLPILKNCEDRLRVFSSNCAGINSKTRKHFRQLGSSIVNRNGAIRQITHDFLFSFHSSCMPMSCRFEDIGLPYQKFGKIKK